MAIQRVCTRVHRYNTPMYSVHNMQAACDIIASSLHVMILFGDNLDQ